MPKLSEAVPGSSANHKKPAARSVAYTAFTIEYGRDFTQNIYSHFGGNSFNSRETIAKILKRSPELLKSPISSCVQYGLLEMRSKVGYKPTARFMDLYKQDDPEIYRNTMIACLKSPPLYATLLESYKGDIVPSLNVLANSLFKKHGILENASEKVASVFLQNLEDLGLIGADRKLLDLDKKPDEINAERLDDNGAEKGSQVDQDLDLKDKHDSKSGKTPPVNDLSFIIEVPLADNRKAKILCPMDVNDKDLTKILRVISSYMEVPYIIK